MLEQLKIGNLEAAPGEKTQGFIRVYDEEVQFPVTLINGISEGKTVLITAGIHGGEYPCIQTAIELAQEIDPMDIAGQIIIIHPVNTSAFKERIFALVSEDKKNLNREFPGDKDGSITQKIAHMLTYEFQSKADFYMDLHGGDLHEAVIPFVYYPGIAEEDIVAASKEVAAVLDVKYMVKSGATTGAYNSAAIRGVPGILVERGGAGIWTKEEVEAYKKDVRSVLAYLGIIASQTSVLQAPYNITRAVYLEADCEGCWYPQVVAGQKVTEGELIGEIRDFFGNTMRSYFAQISGVVLYMMVALAVTNGDPLIAYGEVDF
ncbi:M14 family metallopeptidase [Cellulosilyticum sp. I15G10I2]|uniref:M14 family metallopeptidase n=1 Tax=Cellulosilyticum sp. I15G10I2 TaxID=1892843 RepID=UPI00085CAD6E|nr:M14 family metallopeptidase [Cellulosilyticum sp. I15G10I2]